MVHPARHPHPRRAFAPLLAPFLALVLALAACAGAPVAPDGDDDPGALAVLVSGLPTGAAAAVAVSGPSGFSDAISASETYAGLTPGSYAVAASSVVFEGVTFAATVSGSPANVVAGGLATATVAYAATSTAPGSLTVTIDGLPGGVDGDVQVTGPGGFDTTLTSTTTLTGLEPGSYEVLAAEVDDAGDAYGATVSASPATVPAGGSASALVTYAFLDPTTVGSLDVAITGLPVGVDADVSVTGPGGFDQTLTESTTLAGLTVGNYVIAAANVTADGLTYQGVVDASPALVIGNATTDVSVTYQVVTPNDGDAASAPGLFARFRATSPGPVWVEGLLFNAATPIDTKGIQLRDALGDPADPGDWLAFELVHGQAPTTNVALTLECSTTDTPSPIRVELRDDSGAKIGLNTLCDTTRTIAVPNEGGSGDYVLHVIPHLSGPYFTEYVLSVDAYCFQGCTYQPYEP